MSPAFAESAPVATDALEPLLVAEARRDVPACADALRTLAATLRTPDARGPLQARMTTWLLGGLALFTPPGAAEREWREAVWDAAVDLVADAAALADFLELTAARLDELRPDARPHLLSMLRARAHWRARDRMRQRRGGPPTLAHAADASPEGSAEAAPDAQARLLAGLAVQRVAERFGRDPALADVLRRLLLGENVSEIAQATGTSRQAIYRSLARVRDWLADARSDAAGRPRTGGDHV